MTAQSGASIDVPTTTLDALVDQLGLRREDFIKMDIEGAEREALSDYRLNDYRLKPVGLTATESREAAAEAA